MMRSRFSDREPRSHPSSRDRSPIHRGHERSAAIANDTSDPDRINARIFVGRLVPEITRYMLQDHFSKWGDIIGVTVTNNNFGFIQFRDESEAQACLASGSITTINGVCLDVKPAKLGPTASQTAAPFPAPGIGSRDINSSGLLRRGGWEEEVPSKYGDRREYDQGHDSRHPFRDDNRVAGNYDNRFRSRDSGQGNEGGGNGFYGGHESGFNYRSSYESPSYDKPKMDPLDPERPNDIEIVVPNKMQRAFAESIEARLKRFDLTVDLLFPPSDISPERVLKDLSARHCLYAIFATAEHEKRNSLTLNILHGEPQEHRNMPVEDALRLIQQNFEDYIKKTRLRNMREVVPRDVRSLLLDMLEMRPLSMGDLDKIIKYLRERQNALVDDQIEQKRETAGQVQQSSLLSGNVAVTYPGLHNYVHPVAGAGTGTAIRATGAQGSMNLVSGTNMQGAFSATAYSGIKGLQPSTAASLQMNASALKGFGVSQQSPAQSTNPQFGALSVNASASPSQVGKPSEQELQERILNLMKNSQGLGASPSLQAPTGVPAPSGVPPPVPVAQSLQQQPWMSRQQQSRGNVSQGNHGNQAYNPWSL